MPVESDAQDAALGWTLKQALERTTPPPHWDAWIAAKTAFDKVKVPPTSGPGAFITPNPEIVRAKRQQAVEAFNVVTHQLRQFLLEGRLVAVGSRGSRTVIPTPIYGDGWKSIRFVNFEKSIVSDRSGDKSKIYNVKVFPVVHSTPAIDQFYGASFTNAFHRCVVSDPEAVAASWRVPDRKRYEATFDEGRFPGWSIDYKWPCDCTASDFAFYFVSSPIFFSDTPLPEPSPQIENVAQVLIDRWHKLVQRLSNGELVARGTHVRTGSVQHIDPLQWARREIAIDIKSGDFLEKQNHNYVAIWSGLSVTAPSHVKPIPHAGALASTFEPHAEPKPALGVRSPSDATPQNRQPLTPQQASIEAAIAVLWPHGIPTALTKKMRDQRIAEWQRKEGVAISSPKTIGRYLSIR